MTKPFLILQLRPETEAADDEFSAILAKSGLTPAETQRIRLDQAPLPDNLDLDDYSGIIVGGGPGCVSDAQTLKTPAERRIESEILGLMPEITTRDFPFLGCCYGIGILGHHLKAPVNKDKYGEAVGATDCTITQAGRADRLLDGMPVAFKAFVGHKEAVQCLPSGCVHLIASPACPYQMIRYGQNVYATQFHPEADAEVFELRIRLYRNNGYFDPEDANRLIALCRSVKVRAPELILLNFVKNYRVPA